MVITNSWSVFSSHTKCLTSPSSTWTETSARAKGTALSKIVSPFKYSFLWLNYLSSLSVNEKEPLQSLQGIKRWLHVLTSQTLTGTTECADRGTDQKVPPLWNLQYHWRCINEGHYQSWSHLGWRREAVTKGGLQLGAAVPSSMAPEEVLVIVLLAVVVSVSLLSSILTSWSLCALVSHHPHMCLSLLHPPLTAKPTCHVGGSDVDKAGTGLADFAPVFVGSTACKRPTQPFPRAVHCTSQGCADTLVGCSITFSPQALWTEVMLMGTGTRQRRDEPRTVTMQPICLRWSGGETLNWWRARGITEVDAFSTLNITADTTVSGLQIPRL